MTTGTKVFLAFFALIIGFLVLYYGVWSPGDAPPSAVAPHQADSNLAHATDITQPALGRAPSGMPVDVTQPPPDDTGAVNSNPSPSMAENAPASHVIDPATQEHATGPVPLDPRDVIPLVGMTPTAPAPDSGVKANQPLSIAPSASSGNTALQQQPVPGHATNTGPAKPVPVSVPPSPPPARTSPPQTSEYTIRAGDTFMSIANDWFGDQTKWSMIAKANPLVDPTRLKIGQKIKLPAKDAQPEPIKEQVAATPDSSHYIVRSGDTLAKIARELYGDVAKWKAIYDANKSLIGADPANLKAGTKLTLPANLKKSS